MEKTPEISLFTIKDAVEARCKLKTGTQRCTNKDDERGDTTIKSNAHSKEFGEGTS